MAPTIEQIRFEEGSEWHKVVLPVQRNWLLFGLFTLCVLIWLGMLGGIVANMLSSHYSALLNIMLVIWLIIWLWFGRILGRRWQYYAANREILFINERQVLLRRPVSILGSTDVFDRSHVSPFYYSDKHQCPVFDYAYQHVYFGQSLSSQIAQELVNSLNERFFPDADEE